MSNLIPSQEYRRTDCRVPAKPYKGMDAFTNSWVGRYHRRAAVFEMLKKDAELVEAQSKEWAEMSSSKLHQRLMEMRQKFRRGGREADAALLSGLAAVREAADRKLGMRPFFVQVIGALALHRGYLAEMATGEGKTLTAGVAATLAGLVGRFPEPLT